MRDHGRATKAEIRKLIALLSTTTAADDVAEQLAALAQDVGLRSVRDGRRLLSETRRALEPSITPIGRLSLSRAEYALKRLQDLEVEARAVLERMSAEIAQAYHAADGQYFSLMTWLAFQFRELGDLASAHETEFSAAQARHANRARTSGLHPSRNRALVPSVSPEEEKTTPVTIHFATTRGIDDGAAWGHPYGCEVAPNLSYGTARVIVPLDRNLEQIRAAVRRGQPGYLRRIPFRRGKTELDVVWPQPDEATYWRDLQLTVTKRARREVLIHVHGFNTPFERALERAGYLHAALEIQGATIAFSWPSRGDIFRYEDDARTMRDMPCEPLIETICNAAARADAQLVHVIAHSMGARLALQALATMSQAGRELPNGAKFGHIVLAAADVPHREYRQSIKELGALAGQVTLYASKNDKALWAARFADGKRRAGDARRVTIVSPSHTVDTTRASHGALGHSDFDGTALDDLRALLWFGIAPGLRAFLEPVGTFSGTAWRFRRLKIIDRHLLWCRAGLMISRLAGCQRAHEILQEHIDLLNPVADKILHTDLSKTLIASHQACKGRVTLHYDDKERANASR